MATSRYAGSVLEFIKRVRSEHPGDGGRILDVHFELGNGLHLDGNLWYPADRRYATALVSCHTVSAVNFDTAVVRRIAAVSGWATFDEHEADNAHDPRRPLLSPAWYHTIHINIDVMPTGSALADAVRTACKERPAQVHFRIG